MKKILFVTFSILFCLTSQAQIITTVAGGLGDGATALNTPIYNPFDVAVDRSGNLYLADYYENCIRKINAITGIVSIVAGNGRGDYGGDGANATLCSLYRPYGVDVDVSGNIYIADQYNHRIRKVNAITGIITTIAGNGTNGNSGDGGLATNANLSYPRKVTVDVAGNLYISENNRIRKVNISTGTISTIAGNGTSGYGGDGNSAINALISGPSKVSFDATGNLYFSDIGNNRIRKINVNTIIITTIAGNGIASYSGDGSLATSASLNFPSSIDVDVSGNLFIADRLNHRIRKVNANTGIISTIAGNGIAGFGGDGSVASSASLDNPSDLAIDSSGNLYIADTYNFRIRKVNASSSNITTVAGNGTQGHGGDGSAATSASIYEPFSLAIDKLSNLYISDRFYCRIRKVNLITGIISTVAGSGFAGYGGDGGPAIAASLNAPSGVTVDSLGNLYIADAGNNRIRKVNASSGIISTIVGNGIKGFGGDDSAATNGTLSYPISIALDRFGNFYIADNGNKRIRKVNVNTGIISTIAGNGIAGFGGDGSAANSASLNNPCDLAIDSSGNLYIADRDNHRIRKVNVNTGIISTFAGGGTGGQMGDGGAATAAILGFPMGVAVDAYGNLFIADRYHHRIRKADANTGIISTIAGIGIGGYGNFGGDGGIATDAELAFPIDVALDGAGNLYLSDINNKRIRKVTYFNYIISKNQTMCLDKSMDSLIANNPVGGNITYTYTWLKSTTSGSTGFSAIPASNSVNYKPTALTQNTWFRRYVKYGVYSDTSSAVMMTVIQNPNPRVGFVLNNATQCINGNNFSFTDTSSISSGTITRKWNFESGVNDTSMLLNPNKIYSSANTYAVKLIITSNNDCKDSVTKTILVNPKPIVNFTSPTLFCLSNSNTSFNLINNSSISTGSLSYNWQFSDNTSSSLLNPIKTISDTGKLEVKLIATSNNNCKDSITKTTMVNFKPNAGFTTNNPIQCLTGNNFLFTDTSTIAGGTITRKWNFGTGNNDTSSMANPNKSYSTSNTFSVKLIVTSNNNCKDSTIKSVTVNPKPSANFIINKVAQCLKNNNFIFTNQSTLGFNYLWKFGNGDSSVNISTNYSYTSIGTKAVKLIVSSNNNCKDSITKNIVVNANFIANFTINNDTQNFVGNNFVFTNTSNNSNSQLWNFGDSTSATVSNPTKIYSSFGTKTVQLISNNAGNCYDTISKSIFVNAHPTIGNILGNINPTSTINPYSYSVLSQSNIVYNWSIQNGVIQSGQGTNAVSVIWSNKGTGNIFAKITNNYNLSDSTNLAVNITTVGINDLAINSFSQIHFKPNPFSTNLEINFTSVTKERTKLIITDAIGKEVYVQHFQTTLGDNNIITEDLSTLKPGFYMATLANNNGQSKAFKVLKN